MLVTVAICTLNRAESLARTLESLTALEVPPDAKWEVLIVNNGCTDRTSDVVRSFADRLPIRCVSEPNRGLSRARNRAVESVASDYIIWTDDDVTVDRGWLAAYVAAFRRWPEGAIFGGPTTPAYQSPTPAWLSECEHLLRLPYSMRDYGAEPIRISAPQAHYFVGANCAVRTADQRKFRYKTDLGIAPNQQRLGEETNLFARVLSTGAIGYWVPEARVEHRISRSRQTTGYIARYFAAHGETNMVITRPKAGSRSCFGAPRWLWRQLAEQWVAYRIHRLVSPPAVWMAKLQHFGYTRGMISYWRKSRSNSRSAALRKLLR